MSSFPLSLLIHYVIYFSAETQYDDGRNWRKIRNYLQQAELRR